MPKFKRTAPPRIRASEPDFLEAYHMSQEIAQSNLGVSVKRRLEKEKRYRQP